MEVKIEVKMTPKIMYDFMMYHTYRSFSGIFGIILGIAAFVMFGTTLGKTDLSYSIVYCLFGVWFIVYSSGQPLYKIKKAGRKKRSI